MCAVLTEFAGCTLPPSSRSRSLLLPTDDDAAEADVTVAPFGVSFSSLLARFFPLPLPLSHLSSVLSRSLRSLASSPNEHRFPVMALQRERREGEKEGEGERDR